MFKKGDIVVRTQTTRIGDEPEANIGYIYKCLKNHSKAYYDHYSSLANTDCKKATKNEIKWFNAGITNINQIPEVNNNFWLNGNMHTIEDICYILDVVVYNDTKSLDFKDYIDITNNYESHQNSNHLVALVTNNFKIEDLRKCKIINLTPKDHKIIQPWLISRGYMWDQGYKHTFNIDYNYFFLTPDTTLSLKGDHKYKRIKKETILNYINNNSKIIKNEQINTPTETRTNNTRQTKGTSISSIAKGKIASASRLIGNTTNGRNKKTGVGRFKICSRSVTC